MWRCARAASWPWADRRTPVDPPPGCRFASQCPFAEPRCRAETPGLRAVGPGHLSACLRQEALPVPDFAAGMAPSPESGDVPARPEAAASAR
ncbi:hypothetical protein M0638_21845 [Roseomonas sp. NAR14]|uniref:Oligopeptide/dipeptide ABC transporter C-terminal domain-containing protein n=1 Tax=Roseomonas acroporae TaxID=2937791 RepID=A0A9X1YIX3_9PROT|nr:hypothetical protein [Roseomonas acroporae]MCK8787021.1 hypothetical protein [Roseomonas acroporae]